MYSMLMITTIGKTLLRLHAGDLDGFDPHRQFLLDQLGKLRRTVAQRIDAELGQPFGEAGSFTARATSAAIRSTIGLGVCAGAIRPFQVMTL